MSLSGPAAIEAAEELDFEEGLREEVGRELLAACVHCGFCVPVCPTWDILREENDSPRGRLYLMRAEDEGRVDPGGAFALHLGRCLGCRACESVCPAGVPFGHLLERARARIPPRPRMTRWERWGLALITEPRFTRFTYGTARFLRSLGVDRFLGTVLPGAAGRMLRLLAATRPAFAGGGSGGTEFAEVGPDAATPAEEPQEGPTYALLAGCVMEGLFSHVHAATRRTLRRAGYREVAAPEQACCGALHAHAGLREEARAQARRNIEAFELADPDFIVVDSAGCGAGLKDYPDWLASDPEWRERAEAMAARVRDVTELLADWVATSGEELFPVLRAGAEPERVAYDAPCHLLHGQRIRGQPLDLLRRVPGLEVDVLPSWERCCGGAGTYNLTEPELAAAVRAPKIEEILRGDYDWVATGNPGCIMFIGAGLLRSADPTPVVHPVELVDRAGS